MKDPRENPNLLYMLWQKSKLNIHIMINWFNPNHHEVHTVYISNYAFGCCCGEIYAFAHVGAKRDWDKYVKALHRDLVL